MDGVLKSDIFFFITSAVVIILGIGLGVVIMYLVKILRDVKEISHTVKRETEEMAQDLSLLRTNARNGRALAGLWTFFRGLFARRKKGRK